MDSKLSDSYFRAKFEGFGEEQPIKFRPFLVTPCDNKVGPNVNSVDSL